jgi:glycosyltransferase involved in cell wall biosynthesis
MIDGFSLSLTTRVMKRSEQLREALPSWCRIKEYDQIIIVNWGMHDDVLPMVNAAGDDRITVLQVPDQRYFDSGKTRNVGIRYASGYFIQTIDCDFTTDTGDFLQVIDTSNTKRFYLREPVTPHDRSLKWGGGNCIMPKKAWEEVNGYVEGLPAWGTEDGDFYKKLESRGYRGSKNLKGLGRIVHDDYLRRTNFPFTGSREDGLIGNDAYMKKVDSWTQTHSPVACDIYAKGIVHKNQYI